jgi:SAM-dependent methyltransferase
MEDQKIRKVVREKYGEIASKSTSCCESSTCGCGNGEKSLSKFIGYTKAEIESLPDGANLGLGCGNPLAYTFIKEGDTVLDLGSGAGIDCFLASQKVGQTGKVIGVDMTPKMLDKARENALKGDFKNVEFRLGEIENLPVADNSVDLVISNCVINLSPIQMKVFDEIFRVLKPGGRMVVSDIVLLHPLEDRIKNSVEAYVGCVAGASLKDEYLSYISGAGLNNIEILDEIQITTGWIDYGTISSDILESNSITVKTEELRSLVGSVASVKVSAFKPD